MRRLGRVCSLPEKTVSLYYGSGAESWVIGLVEQAAISKAAKARGLSIVNTDAMSVSTR